MSSRTWACFECRQNVRRVAQYGEAPVNQKVKCPECGGELVYVGFKIPLPPRRDRRAWEDLRRQLVGQDRTQEEERRRAEVRRRHQLEKEIAELAARPHNQERARLIRELRRRLGGA